MKNAFLPAIALLAILIIAGCAQDNTSTVNVYVNDSQGKPVDGASVSAYSNYSLGSGANNKWTSLNGTIQSTGTTKNGSVTLQVIPGQYAFTATTSDGSIGGTEKLVIQKNDYVYITTSKPTPTTGTITISLVDESGKLIDVQNTTIYADATFCQQSTNPNGTGSCTSGSERVLSNPIWGPTKQKPIGTYTFGFYSRPAYQDGNVTFTLNPGDNLTFMVTMKKNPLTPPPASTPTSGGGGSSGSSTPTTGSGSSPPASTPTTGGGSSGGVTAPTS